MCDDSDERQPTPRQQRKVGPTTVVHLHRTATHFFRPDVKRPYVRETEPFHHVLDRHDLLASTVDKRELHVRIEDGERKPG